MIVFSNTGGRVVVVDQPGLPASIAVRLENFGGFATMRSIITSVRISTRGNFQFLHTIGESVHVSVFGDKIGQMAVAGLAFDRDCVSPGGLTGIERVAAYYNRNRIAGRSTPLRLSIGTGLALSAMLIGLDTNVANLENRLHEFTLHLALIPKPPSVRAGSGGSTTPTPAPAPAPSPSPPVAVPLASYSLSIAPGDFDEGGAYQGSLSLVNTAGSGPNTQLTSGFVLAQ